MNDTHSLPPESRAATDALASTREQSLQSIWTPEMEAEIDRRFAHSLPSLGSDPVERARARLRLLTIIGMYLGRQLATVLDELPMAEINAAPESQLETWLRPEALPNPHALAMAVQTLLGGKFSSLIASLENLATARPGQPDGIQRDAEEIWRALDRFAAERAA